MLLSQHYSMDFDNIAIGGLNNDEIFFRTIEAALTNRYKLIVVMWSELGRKCAYYADNNVDDFTMLNYGTPCGFQCSNSEVQTYSKLYYTYFNNQYMALKYWLMQIISLQTLFYHNNQKFLFIKGFENYLLDFSRVKYTADKFIMIMMSDDLKQILDFHNRPDYYIQEKIKTIKNLLQQIDKINWVNFNSDSFFNMGVDTADDQSHPGPITNKLLLDNIIEHITKNNLLNL